MIYVGIIGIIYAICLLIYKICVNHKFHKNRIKYGQKNRFPRYIPYKRYRSSAPNDTQQMLDYHNQQVFRQQQMLNDQMMNHMMWHNMHNK